MIELEEEQRDYLIKREDFSSQEDYEKYSTTLINNLLIDLLRRLAITTEDLKDYTILSKYQIGKDTSIPNNDFTRKLETYKAYDIKVLLVETTPTYIRVLIPNKEPDYEKIVNTKELGYYNTYSFIKQFKPTSGYKG